MNASSTVTIRRAESGYVFSIQGRGTLRESPAVRDFVCGAIDDGASIVLDLCDCEYLDSTFLGCLVMMHQRGANNAAFHVFADQTTRRQLFTTCRVDSLLDFVNGLPECVGEPVELQITSLERTEFCRHLMDTHQRLAELGGPAAETFRSIVQQLKHDLESPE